MLALPVRRLKQQQRQQGDRTQRNDRLLNPVLPIRKDIFSFIIETPFVPKLKQFLFINVKLSPSEEAQNDFTHDSRRIIGGFIGGFRKSLFCLLVFIILISPESQV